MSTGVSTSTDKIIVDRSRSHRNKAVSKAVRQTRERLQSGHVQCSGFDREMLRMHVDSPAAGRHRHADLRRHRHRLGVYLTADARSVAWALLTLCVHMPSTCCSAAAPRSRRSPPKVSRNGAGASAARPVAHRLLLGGLRPAGLRDLRARSTSASTRAPTLLIALAVTAMANFMLRNAVLFTFAPAVVALAAKAALPRNLRRHGADRRRRRRRSSSSSSSPTGMFQSQPEDPLLPVGKGRSDRRARSREIDVGRSAPPRRGGQPRQIPFPRLDVARAAHAAQRHPRLLRGHVDGGHGAAQQSDLQGIYRRYPSLRPASARPDQRDPRPLAHRGRQVRAERRGDLAARYHRGLHRHGAAARPRQEHLHHRAVRARACRRSGSTRRRCAR